MATFKQETLKSAHRHSSSHRDEIANSSICGCFHCLGNFQSVEINEWLDEENGNETAFCPKCTIDAVIGSASGYPVEDQSFLKAMQQHWFGYGPMVSNTIQSLN